MTVLDPLPRVSLDESGNTGEALLDADQPVYVLASTSLSEEAALHLIESVGWPTGHELKYSKLRRSRNGRRVIGDIMRQLTPTTAKVAVAHKRFMVIAKLVDRLVEPLLAANDYNLYERGGQRALTEVWHAAMPAFIGADAYEELLSLFIKMSRSPTMQTTDAFFDHIARLVGQVSDPRMRDHLLFISATRTAFGLARPYPGIRGDLDPAVPFLFATADEWGKTFGTPFAIDHDHAKVVQEWLPELEPYLFSAATPARIGAGVRSFTVPLFLTRVDLVDSAASFAVQVVDVLAGGTRQWVEVQAGLAPPSNVEGSLLELDLMPLVMPDSIWPAGEISADETARLSLNPADEMAAFARIVRSRPQ